MNMPFKDQSTHFGSSQASSSSYQANYLNPKDSHLTHLRPDVSFARHYELTKDLKVSKQAHLGVRDIMKLAPPNPTHLQKTCYSHYYNGRRKKLIKPG